MEATIESVFEPEPRPRVLKTNINNITKYVSQRITGFGFNVYLSYSNKSKSRYLEIVLTESRKMIVRISDHPADKANRWRYKFDIHTISRRRGSVDYIDFLDAFKRIICIKRQGAKKINPGRSRLKE
jgi:hypothetical protein